MWPLAGFAFGAVVGAVGVALRGSQIAEHARPAAKAMLKAALAAAHEAHVRQVEATEAVEDLYAEAEAEVMAERRAHATAAAAGEGHAPRVSEDDLRDPHVTAAVEELYKLYAETNGNVTPDKVAKIIAMAKAKVVAEMEAGKSREAASPTERRS
jgi:hypothetical protein